MAHLEPMRQLYITHICLRLTYAFPAPEATGVRACKPWLIVARGLRGKSRDSLQFGQAGGGCGLEGFRSTILKRE